MEVFCSGHSVRGRILPPDHVWIHDAKLDDTIVCFPVKRNIYGKIFGGFLMRKALELAWANASIFSSGTVTLVRINLEFAALPFCYLLEFGLEIRIPGMGTPKRPFELIAL
ncbi:unnamed protein product [Gongylonema pulchrum]|uniref:HotDog ACOT-type domain-containing protein n=1 Tax=Gongylonema pulchrum TaxID=637853 RepID=A0A183DM47_9BILA|nr:unnamed protein product [Gongylonema pulchrum]